MAADRKSRFRDAAKGLQTKGKTDDVMPWFGIPIKWFVLTFLVFQNTAAVLLMRHSRSSDGGQSTWDPQVGVIMQEILKAVGCLVLMYREGELGASFADKTEFAKAGVPAVLYLVQNNMQYVALSFLNAPTYAVLYQLKILSTAVVSVLLLGKSLSKQQWLALCVLTLGVACVTLSQINGTDQVASTKASLVTGVSAVLLAALMSGLAGASMEKILRGPSTKDRLWVRSFQLTFHSIVVGSITFLFSGSRAAVLERGIFHGFNVTVWLSVANNAFGGLLIAMVIKHADSIMKNFSQSFAIILTASVSFFVSDSSISLLFILGTSLVIYAMFMYAHLVPTLRWLVANKAHAL